MEESIYISILEVVEVCIAIKIAIVTFAITKGDMDIYHIFGFIIGENSHKYFFHSSNVNKQFEIKNI